MQCHIKALYAECRYAECRSAMNAIKRYLSSLTKPETNPIANVCEWA
jgi:hypothetical protein